MKKSRTMGKRMSKEKKEMAQEYTQKVLGEMFKTKGIGCRIDESEGSLTYAQRREIERDLQIAEDRKLWAEWEEQSKSETPEEELEAWTTMKPRGAETIWDDYNWWEPKWEKARLDLNPPEADYAMAAAFEDGATKYGPHDWEQKGFDVNERLAAIKRHVNQLLMGEEVAIDSQIHHAAHILADAAMIITSYIRRHKSGGTK